MSSDKPDVPRFDRLLKPLLEGLKALGGSATLRELEDWIAEHLQLTEAVLTVPHDGSRGEFSYQLAWTRTYLKKVGAVSNSIRGVWSITDAGRGLTEVELRG